MENVLYVATSIQSLFTTPARELQSEENFEHGSTNNLESNKLIGDNNNNNNQRDINLEHGSIIDTALKIMVVVKSQLGGLQGLASQVKQEVGALKDHINDFVNSVTQRQYDTTEQMDDMNDKVNTRKSEVNTITEDIEALQDVKHVKDSALESLKQKNNNSRNLVSPSVQSNTHIGTTNKNEYNNHVNKIGRNINNNNKIIGNGNRRCSIIDLPRSVNNKINSSEDRRLTISALPKSVEVTVRDQRREDDNLSITINYRETNVTIITPVMKNEFDWNDKSGWNRPKYEERGSSGGRLTVLTRQVSEPVKKND